MRSQVVPDGRYPVLQPRPPAQQGFMGDLDGRCLCAWVAVEGEQSSGSECVDRERELRLVDVEGVELGALDAAARVDRVAERDQAEEELAHRVPTTGVQSLVEPLRPAGEGAGDAADLVVGGEGEPAFALPLV